MDQRRIHHQTMSLLDATCTNYETVSLIDVSLFYHSWRNNLNVVIAFGLCCLCLHLISPALTRTPLRVIPSKIPNLERKSGQYQDPWVCPSETTLKRIFVPYTFAERLKRAI